MEECESLDTEMTELQELQCDSPEAADQGEEDEVEELRNSLREAVQDQSVKPKLQCLMVDPSFSMVTVQSEDSGIIWETASSRCSTPWASETSSTSEEGAGAQGKITIVFDDEKIERRRKRSGGRSSRLADRFRRPSSSRSGSALGVERLEMAEVSVPNVKPEKTSTDLDLEEIKDKDQQLFSLISEGYEILNIRVPSKLPTVDEEESTDLQDNLSYLEETPMIKSRIHRAQLQQEDHALPGVVEVVDYMEEATEEDSSKPLVHKEFRLVTRKDGASDMDYFEKFTLVDVVGPSPELQEEVEQPAAKPQEEELKSEQETFTDAPSTPDDDSFVFVTDVEFAGEHLDEVFYGNGVHGAPDDVLQRRDDEEEAVVGRRSRRESQKESGSVLFGSEETILTPIFLSPGPPKIIDLILLEEPTAMSFMYSDLYEDAMGERRSSDDEYSDAETGVSERSFKRRLSDSEETDGYLEKFILKDDIPTVEVHSESKEDDGKGKRMWSQSKFEMTGCLTRVVEEADEVEEKREEPKVEEVSSADRGGNLQPPTCEETEDMVVETQKEREEIQPAVVIEEQVGSLKTSPEESVQVPQPETEKTEEQEGKQEVKEDQTEPSESITDTPVTVPETQQVDIKIEKPEEMIEQQKEEPAETIEDAVVEIEQSSQTQMEEVVTGVTLQEETPAEAKEPVSIEVPKLVSEPEAQTDTVAEPDVPAKIEVVAADKPEVRVEETEKMVPEEAAVDTKIVAAVEEEKIVTEEAAIDSKIVAAVEEEKIVTEEASVDTKIVAAVEEEKMVPEEASVDTTIVAAVEEEKIVTEEASVDTKIVAAVEEEKMVPEEAAVDTKIVAAVEEEKIVTEEAAVDTKIVAAVEEEKIVTEEAAVDTKIVAAVEEEKIVTEEAAVDTKIVAAVEEEKMVPEEAAIDTKIVAAVEEEKMVPEEAAIDTKIVAAVEEEKMVPEEAAIDTKIVAAVEEEKMVPEEAAIDTTIVAAVEEEKVVPEEAAIDTKIVAAVEEEKMVPEEAVIDTKMVAAVQEAEKVNEEPTTVCQEVVTCVEPSVETETPTEVKENEKIEVVVLAGKTIPVEVIIDSEPVVEAVVELAEKIMDEGEVQTQVQIALWEVISAETPEVKAEIPEEEISQEAVIEKTAAIADHVQEVTTETVPSGVIEEHIMSEEVKPQPDEKLVEVPEPDQSQPVEAVTDEVTDKTEKPAEEVETETSVEATQAVVPETVNVGDELILLVPKGKAVEMNIEIGKLSDLQKNDARACVELIFPDTSAPPKPKTQHIELVMVLPALKAPVSIEEVEVEKPKMEKNLEEDLRSVSPQEDLSRLHTEDLGPQIEMHKEEVVLETHKEDAGPVMEVHKEAEISEIHKEEKEEKEAEVLETEIHKEDVIPVVEIPKEVEVLEIHKEDIGLVTELHKEDVGPVMELHQEAEIPNTELLREDVGTETEIHKEAEVLETEIHKEDVIPVVEIPKEVEVLEIHKEDVIPVVEIPKEVEVLEIHKEDVGPVMEVHKEDAGPVLTQHREAEDSGAELHKEDVCTETEMNKEAEASETEIHKEEVGAVVELQREDVGPDMEHLKEDIGPAMVLHNEAEVPETESHKLDVVPEVTAEELEYEIISKQEAREMPEPEMERVAEEPHPDSEPDREGVEKEMEESVLDLPPGEEFIEADYDIIDAEEESQARAAAELQGMDWFCLTCGCLLSETDSVSGAHRAHEVTSVEKAYEDIKERLSNWISELQGRSENIEDLVSELELAYNSVEDQCTESEGAMQAQNEEMMALVMEQYNSMSLSMEEEKKAKLEQLYDQIVSFQESIDSAKGTLETTAREAETDARSSEDINTRLRAALESAMSLELGPRGLLVFEDYAKGNTSNSHLAQRKGIPVPQKPTLQLQEQGSATGTSVTVYWKVNPGDIIDCFQVYCMEDPQGAVSEEYRVTVKESYCVLEELEPDKTYKVWVMAVNYTGCSLPSERLAFRTAPSVPVIDTERCTVQWDSATLRWTPANPTPAYSYTLEYCRQYELEGEGLRSISGIRGTEQRVLLQPDENYLFYIKAVNEAGASEQSEAALISTKGTRFHLLKASAHPVLDLSEDQTTLHYSQDTYNNTPHADSQCPSILGELLPARGHYYWETTVTGSTSYRIGVAYGTANRNLPLGENSASWCLHCIPTPSSCRFELLHDDVQSDVFVIEAPEQVGTLLDFQHDSLSFYNAKSGQLLGCLSHHFTQPCHPVLGMELPGSLEVSMVLEVPEFAKHS